MATYRKTELDKTLVDYDVMSGEIVVTCQLWGTCGTCEIYRDCGDSIHQIVERVDEHFEDYHRKSKIKRVS